MDQLVDQNGGWRNILKRPVGKPLKLLRTAQEQQIALVAGIQKQRSQGDIGASRDLPGGGFVKAFFDKQVPRGNFYAPQFFEFVPFTNAYLRIIVRHF